MHNLFAYGTLQLPEVMLAVAGRTFPAHAARLRDFSRHRLRGKSFPGIRPAPGAAVDGLLFVGLDAQTQRRLDEFEDSFYRRETVAVTTVDGVEWLAQAYVIEESAFGLLLPEEWRLEDFQRHRLDRFLLNHE